MAEGIASLVIGGVGLLSMFDSCVNAFNYVDAGRQYGTDYQRAAFQISLLQLRLTRWKKSVDIRENLDGISDKVQRASDEEVASVKELLGHIQYDFEVAEESSKRYKLKNPPPAEQGTEAATLETLSNRVRDMSLRQQKSSSVIQKTRWALHDKKKFDRLVEDLGSNINSLVTLFPAVSEQQVQLAQTELGEIIQPSEIEEPEEAVRILRETSEGVDPQLVAAMQHASAAAGGYFYNRMTTEGQAQGQFGTYFAPGQYQKGHKGNATFNDVVATGSARAHYGDNVGGPYVLGGDFHQQMQETHGDTSAGAQQNGEQEVRRYGR